MSTQDATECSRGENIAKELIGDFREHIYVTDRYSAYDFLPDKNRQVCWAHLKSDFQKISERPGVPGGIGRKLLKTYECLFTFWKTEYAQACSHLKKPRKRLHYFKAKLLRHLRQATRCPIKQLEHAPIFWSRWIVYGAFLISLMFLQRITMLSVNSDLWSFLRN
ncbi:Transposase IS66 family protein [Legionella santicrucis]|uniref:Transposase IS66 family protein n=1 Tax=Legionella santicrucis TaxID=45074 RepID=A0A0W0YA52_9GAMM|nr:transposase [Legionella santicrucis]KTD53809.1 Transposase IS66 family protein [Legionella santicrucis]